MAARFDVHVKPSRLIPMRRPRNCWNEPTRTPRDSRPSAYACGPVSVSRRRRLRISGFGNLASQSAARARRCREGRARTPDARTALEYRARRCPLSQVYPARPRPSAANTRGRHVSLRGRASPSPTPTDRIQRPDPFQSPTRSPRVTGTSDSKRRDASRPRETRLAHRLSRTGARSPPERSCRLQCALRRGRPRASVRHR